MLRKFVNQLKTFFGAKPKAVPPPPVVIAKESQAGHTPRRTPPHEQPHGTRQIRPPRHPEHREGGRPRKEPPKVQRQGRERIIPDEPWDHSVFKIPVMDGKMRFHDFDIPPEVMHGIYDLGFQYCTPVQAETLGKALAGEDVTAQAQTGTGKTAAYLITIFNHILRHPIEGKRHNGTPRALILAPTRELAMQIEKDAYALGTYVPCSILALLGGIGYTEQAQALKSEPCDVLMCTPGRLMDFQRKGLVDLGKVEILVLDEADRMLDMGFIASVSSIVHSTPPKAKRQTMFFSATMSSEVRRLAESWTRQAFEVNVMPEEVAVQTVEQITYITTADEKPTLVYNLIMQKHLERVLMFVNRRDEARRLKDTLDSYGISCALLSGDVEQQQRIRRLERFREGKVRVLVATDVASRGIHVEAISHVINYNMPQDVEEYVHRIGRTGRAGASGISISFADEYDSYELAKLEEFLGKKISCVYPEPHLLEPIPPLDPRHAPKKRERREPHRRTSRSPRKRR